MGRKNSTQSGGEAEIRGLIERLRREEDGGTDGDDAFGALLAHYLPLVEKTVGRFSDATASESDREDLRQEALLCFYRAAMSYDLSQEHVSFGLYAQICMTNRLVSCVRRMKRHAEEQTLSLESGGELADAAGTGADPTEPLAARERLDATYAVIRRVLSSFEFAVWQHYVEGLSAREIAVRLGKTEKNVTNAVGRIRKKLRAARSEFDF